MMRIIACCEITSHVLPYGYFPTRVFKDVGIDLSRKVDFEVPNTYDTYDDQSMRRMKFEKALDGSWVRKTERALRQVWGQGQAHPRVDEEAEIQEMEGGIDSQSGYQQRGSKTDIPPLQTEGVQFEATFFELIMSESTFIEGPSTQSSYIEFFCSGPTFTKPNHNEIPPPQAPLAPNHALWMDLSTQISSLDTRMEELVMVSDTHFYSKEDGIDQYQVGFTSQFEYLQQRIEHIEHHLEHQHEEMMTYLCSVFPPPPPQP